MVLTLEGMVIVVIFEFSKAFAPIVVTSEGIVKLVTEGRAITRVPVVVISIPSFDT